MSALFWSLQASIPVAIVPLFDRVVLIHSYKGPDEILPEKTGRPLPRGARSGQHRNRSLIAENTPRNGFVVDSFKPSSVSLCVRLGYHVPLLDAEGPCSGGSQRPAQ